MIPVGDWNPDRFAKDAALALDARNVIPAAESYRPFPAFDIPGEADAGAFSNAFSSAFDYTTAAYLLAVPKSRVFVAQKADGSFAYFVGTATKLYRLLSLTTGWVDVSRTSGGDYSLQDPDLWDFTQYGTKVIATNVNDVVQVIDVDSGSNFAALAGSPPQAKYCAVVGDFLFLGNLSTGRRKIMWSAFGVITGWTAGTDQSDEQEFPDGGEVRGIEGGQVALVFQERIIRKASYVPGSDYIFAIDKIFEGRGLSAPFCRARVGDNIFFLADDGFYSTVSGPIGHEKFNIYFADDVEPTWKTRTIAVIDPKRPLVYITYRSVNNAQNYYDKMLIYNWISGRPSYAEVSVTSVGAAATTGQTLEDLNSFGSLESVTPDLDSPVWAGGVPTLLGISSTYALGFFTGANAEAVVTTGEQQLVRRSRAFVNEIAVDADTDDYHVSVATRETQGDSVVFGSESSAGVTGNAPVRSSGRFHRFKVRIPAGTTWTHIRGVDPVVVRDGAR